MMAKDIPTVKIKNGARSVSGAMVIFVGKKIFIPIPFPDVNFLIDFS